MTTSKGGASSLDDPEIAAAIQMSLKSEPLSLDQRSRIDDTPVGLKNVGNTCYFNSFIQALFFLPNMTTKLLGSNIQGQYQAQMKQLKQQKAKDKEEKQQIEDKL